MTMTGDPRPAALELVRNHSASAELLWMRYWANGGNAPFEDFDAYLHGLLDGDSNDHEILATAVEDVTSRP